MRRIVSVFLAACFLLSLAACESVEKAPDTAVEERLVTVFRQGLDAALEELELEAVPGTPGKAYAGEFFWCGEKLETRMYFYDRQARYYGAEQTLEVSEETKAHIQKCTELFQEQFGAIYSVAWDDQNNDGHSVTFEEKDGAEAEALAEEKLQELWGNPDETRLAALRYPLPYLPSDNVNVRGTRVAELLIRIPPEDQAHAHIIYSITNFDVSGRPANAETGAE